MKSLFTYHRFYVFAIVFFITILCSNTSFSQIRNIGGSSGNTENIQYDRQGRPMPKSAKGSDSLQRRDRFADSITIFYRFYDSTRNRLIDSSINDFTSRTPVPYTYDHLGNYGTAARNYIFSPILQTGFDAGFHQFDVYKYTVNNTKFFQTTRPFTEFAYMLGSRNEQLVDIVHTQNKKSNVNFSLEYRFMNSPGLYRIQNNSHNNIRATFHYQSPIKRYESFFIFINNKHAASENGGLVDKKGLDSLSLNNPFELETRLGVETGFSRNPFNTRVVTGNVYRENIFLYRQQYDFGQKDSIVTDSSVIRIFYPRFRLQHTLQLQQNDYLFTDANATDSLYNKFFAYSSFVPDSAVLNFNDKWSIVKNEVSIISFPQKNNQNQYLKIGAELQNFKLNGSNNNSAQFYGFMGMAEYRNRTRNNVWDIVAQAQLHVLGFYAGDYNAYISLQRSLTKNNSALQIGFQNVNRTPSYIFSNNTNFPITNHSNFNKENTIKAFGTYTNNKLGLVLKGNYFLVSNYAYSNGFFTVDQESTVFNLLHISAEKKFKIFKNINWYTEIHLQQATAGTPVNIPFLLTRNRVAFEGNFYKNLYLSTGVEFRYITNHAVSEYSPFIGQFFFQDNFILRNRPDVHLFFHFRIKSFKSFIRLENLNSLNFKTGNFNSYNFKGQQYAGQGMWLKFGVWWNFIN